jgi:hypothetical protein
MFKGLIIVLIGSLVLQIKHKYSYKFSVKYPSQVLLGYV